MHRMGGMSNAVCCKQPQSFKKRLPESGQLLPSVGCGLERREARSKARGGVEAETIHRPCCAMQRKSPISFKCHSVCDLRIVVNGKRAPM